MKNSGQINRLSIYLAYAGALPFLICAVLLVFNIPTIPFLGNIQQILSVYALVIAAFIAGSHWGLHLDVNDKWGIYLPKLSNLIAILLWIGFLVLPFKLLLLTFIITFLVLLGIDQKLLRHDLISTRYFHMRCLVTVIVISTLIISGIYA
jgi:hypothetical protein